MYTKLLHRGYDINPRYIADIPQEIDEWLCSEGEMDVYYITNECAREIAAWYQAPDNSFAVFASTGGVTDTFIQEIREELYSPARLESNLEKLDPDTEGGYNHISYVDALHALKAHVEHILIGE